MMASTMSAAHAAGSVRVAAPRSASGKGHVASLPRACRAARTPSTAMAALYDEGIERTVLESMDFEDGSVSGWMNETLINLKMKSKTLMDDEMMGALASHWGSTDLVAKLSNMPKQPRPVALVGRGDAMGHRDHFLQMAAHADPALFESKQSKSMRSRDRLLHQSA